MSNKITVEQIEDYTFTKKQKAAYEALKKACARCKAAGLDLVGKQWDLHAYPTKFYTKDMVASLNACDHTYLVPYMSGAAINDCGADDMEYFKDECVQR